MWLPLRTITLLQGLGELQMLAGPLQSLLETDLRLVTVQSRLFLPDLITRVNEQIQMYEETNSASIANSGAT